MKLMKLLLPVLFCLAISCAEEKSQPHFELSIEDYQEDGSWMGYLLTDTSLNIRYSNIGNNFKDTIVVFHTKIENNDSLLLVNNLDIRSYSCEEQHLLDVWRVFFRNDSGLVQVDPNVNHPAELDYAVKLINSLVPADKQLEFMDVQPAIEPDGRLRI
jgi:hypothetical protein